MKKLIIFLSIISFYASVSAQAPSKRSGDFVTAVDEYSRAGKLSGLAIYPDTLVFNGTNGLDSVGSKIYVRSGVNVGEWTREYNGVSQNHWVKVGSGGGGSGCTTFYVTSDSLYFVRDSCGVLDSTQIVGDGSSGGVANIKTTQDITLTTSGDTSIIGRLIPNGLVLPGTVTWSGTGLIMDVANPQYYFNQTFFSLASTQITLDAADGTYPRFDVIYVDSSGNIGKITGTASATPVIPQVDPQSQILLSAIYLAASATTPSNISDTLVYDENVEWATSSSGTGTVDFNDVSNPYHSTKDIKVTTSNTGFTLIFTSPTTDSASISDVLKFFFYTATSLPYGYKIQFFAGSNPVSTALSISQVGYGYNPNNLGTYQNISIPFAAFTFYSPEYNIIKITNLGNNTNPVFFDYISVQKGNYNFAPTDYSNKVDSTTISGGNEYWWSKGIPHLAGSVGGDTPSLQDVTDVGFVTTNPIASSVLVSAGSIDGTTNHIAIGNFIGGLPSVQYNDPTTSTETNLVADSITEGASRELHLPDNNGTLIATINGEHPTSDGNINISGGGTTNANNGLSLSGDTVQLGGTLTKPTTISSSIETNRLTISNVSSSSSNPVLTVSTSSTGQAIKTTGSTGTVMASSSTTGIAIEGTSTSGGVGISGVSLSGIAVKAIANSGTALVATSTTGYGATIATTNINNSAVQSALLIYHSPYTGSGANGIGVSFDFASLVSNLTIQQSSSLISKWTDATYATRTSEFSITGVSSGTTNVLLSISGAGVFTLVQGLTNYTDNAAAITGGLTTGQLYRNGDIVQIVH